MLSLLFRKEQRAWVSKVRGLLHEPQGKTPMLYDSYEWNRDCYREEDIIHPHRRLHAGQSGHRVSEHWNRVLRNGTGLPCVDHESTKDSAGILEDVWRVSSHAGTHTGDCYRHAEGHTVRVSKQHAVLPYIRL